MITYIAIALMNYLLPIYMPMGAVLQAATSQTSDCLIRGHFSLQADFEVSEAFDIDGLSLVQAINTILVGVQLSAPPRSAG